MKKVIDENQGFIEDEAFNPEGAFASDGVFSDNALLVDYLNALLVPHPQMNLEFGKGRSLRGVSEDDAQHAEESIILTESLVTFEIERAKSEAKELRSENEALRLKNARLIAQLNETECSFDAVLKQSDTLKSRIAALENQLKISRMITKNHVEISKIITKNAKRRVPDDAALVLDKIVRLEVEPVAEMDAQVIVELAAPAAEFPALQAAPEEVPAEVGEPDAPWEFALEPEVEPVHPVLPDIAVSPVAAALLLDIEADAEEQPQVASGAWLPIGGRYDGVLQPQDAPEPVTVIRAMPVDGGHAAGNQDAPAVALPEVNVEVKRPVPAEMPTPVRERVAAVKPLQKSKTASRVMKSNDAKKPTVVKADPVEKVMLQPAPISAEDAIEGGNKGEPEAGPQAIEPEVTQAVAPEDVTADRDLLQPAGLDETQIERAPVPKVVVRRQMLNYKESQQEKDAGEVKTGHDIGRL